MNALARPVSRTEVVLLAALLFVLPLLEVPKNLLWLAWVLVTLKQGGRSLLVRPGFGVAGGSGPVGGSGVDLCGIALILMLLAALLAGLGQASPGRNLAEAGDWLRLLSVAWLMSRRPYQEAHLVPVLWSALAGTVLATLWGMGILMSANQPMFLQLHSVGHVNHSSIYLAIAFGCALALVAASPADVQRRRVPLAVAVAAALLLAIALMITASRASVGAALVFIALLAWSAPFGDGADPRQAARLRRRLRIGLLALVLTATGGYRVAAGLSDKRLQPEGQSLLEKFGFQASVGAPTSHRDGLIRLAWAAGRSHPLFGLGNGGFSRLNPANVCVQLKSSPASPDCDPARYYFSPHAHSLYANQFAERGALGLSAVLLLLGAWAWQLWATLAWARARPRQAAIWIASLGGWSITVFAGLLNTTLHHEHGLLAMATLGMLLAAGRRGSERTLAAKPADEAGQSVGQ